MKKEWRNKIYMSTSKSFKSLKNMCAAINRFMNENSQTSRIALENKILTESDQNRYDCRGEKYELNGAN